MKNTFKSLQLVINVIAVLIFIAGLVLTLLGGYDFIMIFTHLGSGDSHHLVGIMGVALLRFIDLLLIAVVFFVLSLGILILFNNSEGGLPVRLPAWLRIKNFMDLKVILWEAILTTMVVAYMADLAEKKFHNIPITLQSLIIPGGIFLISVSLFFLKKSEKHEEHPRE